MHRSTDGIGAPAFTDINLSVISVNVGAPVSSVPPELELDGFFPSGPVRPDSKFVRSG